MGSGAHFSERSKTFPPNRSKDRVLLNQVLQYSSVQLICFKSTSCEISDSVLYGASGWFFYTQLGRRQDRSVLIPILFSVVNKSTQSQPHSFLWSWPPKHDQEICVLFLETVSLEVKPWLVRCPSADDGKCRSIVLVLPCLIWIFLPMISKGFGVFISFC